MDLSVKCTQRAVAVKLRRKRHGFRRPAPRNKRQASLMMTSQPSLDISFHSNSSWECGFTRKLDLSRKMLADSCPSLPRSSYYTRDNRQTAALIRARQPYLVKNIFTGIALTTFVISVCKYHDRHISIIETIILTGRGQMPSRSKQWRKMTSPMSRYQMHPNNHLTHHTTELQGRRSRYR